MHVIMKLPEGFDEEKYPKFYVAHRKVKLICIFTWLTVLVAGVRLCCGISVFSLI